MGEASVAVYHDEGTGEFSRACLISALARSYAGKARVRRIYAAELCASDAWHADTCLLALPGGADLPYCAKLNGRGNASILRYIERGGAFLGVCAGAYYASARIAFEPEAPRAITGVRELALFAGVARGSLHELAAPYALDHLRCATVAALNAPASRRTLSALYWGGPEFVPDQGARYEALLRYVTADRRDALAAVRIDVGQGRAVLTGVHAEISGDQFPCEVSRYDDDSYEHGMRVSAELSLVEAERRQTFELLIAALTR